MAKKRGRKKSTVTGYFRTIFNERPEWLHQKSNDDVLARYRADHGMSAGKDVDKSVKGTLANLKSIMRKEYRETGGPAIAIAVRPARGTGSLAHKMETLEELIDDCLSAAKTLDADGLKNVIRNLRSARNEIVWKLGQ